jgi:hypothetical protein
MKMKYKLNSARDIDRDEPDVFILNLPAGFRFDEGNSPNDRSHVRGYDTMKELRAELKAGFVVECDCPSCLLKLKENENAQR